MKESRRRLLTLADQQAGVAVAQRVLTCALRSPGRHHRGTESPRDVIEVQQTTSGLSGHRAGLATGHSAG